MSKISYYSSLGKTTPADTLTVNDWLTDVAGGKWQAQCDRVAAESDHDKRQALKKAILGGITGSGTFSQRGNAYLVAHSGYIVMDFDALGNAEEVEARKVQLAADPYTYAVGLSASHTGLWAFVPIDGKKHSEAFDALKEYYMSAYGLIADKACREVARFRYNTYDPRLTINHSAETFKKYLTKAAKAAHKVPVFITTESDTDELIQRIAASGIDLTQGDYSRYLRLGFAVAEQWGEAGASRFHTLCQSNEKYDYDKCEKQYKYCLRGSRNENNGGVGVGTLYHYAKQAGIDTASQRTQYVATVARQTKAAGRDMGSAQSELALRGISGDEVDSILKQVNETPATLRPGDELTLFGRLEVFLQFQHPTLKRNAITRKIELKGQPLEDKQVNSIYISATKSVDEKVARSHVEALIYSDFIDDYNPLLQFFDNYRGRHTPGTIAALAASVSTSTGKRNPAKLDPGYLQFFFTKWLVGLIASAHGEHSPLLLAFTGIQNSGKTHFFRHLLPPVLQPYYAESKLDAGKDDEILMTQKLLVCDDEMGGKSKRDETRLKELTSKQVFTLREPYGRQNVDLKRLAVLCGTSNQPDLLNDPTGNRRIIPVDVLSIDHASYNAVDKIELLIEAYHLFRSGHSWHLTGADIARLADQSAEFEGAISERELLQQNFTLPAPNGVTEWITATEIRSYMEKETKYLLSLKTIGQQLQSLGFERRSVRQGTQVRHKYGVVKCGTAGTPLAMPVYGDPGTPGAAEIEKLPF